MKIVLQKMKRSDSAMWLYESHLKLTGYWAYLVSF